MLGRNADHELVLLFSRSAWGKIPFSPAESGSAEPRSEALAPSRAFPPKLTGPLDGSPESGQRTTAPGPFCGAGSQELTEVNSYHITASSGRPGQVPRP